MIIGGVCGLRQRLVWIIVWIMCRCLMGESMDTKPAAWMTMTTCGQNKGSLQDPLRDIRTTVTIKSWVLWILVEIDKLKEENNSAERGGNLE